MSVLVTGHMQSVLVTGHIQPVLVTGHIHVSVSNRSHTCQC